MSTRNHPHSQYVQVDLIMGIRAHVLIQAKRSVTLDFVQSIGNARALTLKEQAVISRRAHDAADDRGKEWDNEIVVGCCEDLATIQDGREQAGTKVTSRVNSLGLLALP